MKQYKIPARNHMIIELFRSGRTMQQIGNRFRLSRERVRQILSRFGVETHEGGKAVISAHKKREHAESVLA